MGWSASLTLQVVELDPLVEEVANKYFGFSTDEQLQVSYCTIKGLKMHIIVEPKLFQKIGKNSPSVKLYIKLLGGFISYLKILFRLGNIL